MEIRLIVNPKLSEGTLNHSYSPLQNLKLNDVIGDFTLTNKSLNLSINHPLNIECQPSYDGTVNLIINDDINPPRIINTRFSKIEDNKFKIINRNQSEQSNIYHPDRIDEETRLIRTTNTIPVLDFVRMDYNGQLKGGNYTFYIKFADSDENETDIICESSTVSVFNGSFATISSIHGPLLNETTDKSVTLYLSNIDKSFPKLYVYYSRETSDLNGFRTTEYGKFIKPYDVIEGSQYITIYGYEESLLLTENDLNINYLHISAAKTQAQVQNMLFFGNVQNEENNFLDLQQISYFVKVSLKQQDDTIGYIEPNTYIGYNGSEYYDPRNIYYNLGYWPGEYYRIGIVYIKNDNQLTPVFSLRGCAFQKINDSNLTESDTYDDDISIARDSFLASSIFFSNSMGVFKNPLETDDSRIINFENKTVKPWYYEATLDPNSLDKLKELGIKGYFFVRQKRIPTTLCQGISIGVDKFSNIPCLYDDSVNKYFTESFASGEYLRPNKIYIDNDKVSYSGIISVEAQTIPELQSQLNGSEYSFQKIGNGVGKALNDNSFVVSINSTSSEYKVANGAFVRENIPYKYVNSVGFSTRVGSELDIKDLKFFGFPSSDKNNKLHVIRGIYTSFIGVNSLLDPNCIYNIQNTTDSSWQDDFEIRCADNSQFYAISNRLSISDTKVNLYRGDCFTSTVTTRINRNFRDPDTPVTDVILNENSWIHYKGTGTTAEEWAEINRADVNSVQLGTWLTYKCLSTYNLGLRSEDTSDVDEVLLLGTPKSFHPHTTMNTSSAFKTSDSTVLNRGLSSTTSRKWNFIVQNVPYIKNNFDNRVMFSNVFTEENFRNGYRIFQGLSYKDIDRQYGAIVKLLPWGTNLFCVFEHGLGIIPINEKALIQTSTNQSIHMYGAGVIQNQISLISPDFGSIWQESVIKTPLGVYGVDTYTKKIWRFSDRNGLEMLSDMKIQRFLNEHLKLRESDKYPTISLKNVKTHYNNYKGDVMFTFYNNNENETWNFCFNERLNKWVTRYSWTPLYSENIDNIFYSLDQERAKVLACIYNNKNCTYGIRCDCNELNTNSYECQLSFKGSVEEPESYEIIAITAKCLNEDTEVNRDISTDCASIQDSKLTIDYTKLTNELKDVFPIHLFVKINCKFENNSYSYQDVVGIINKTDLEKYKKYSVNGFYVHGRTGIFNELNYSDANMTNQILPTKWYNKQEPFEFEFVVNGENVGFHKIFNNLVIISNNVQPSQFEFSVIGDVYGFNKSGIFRSSEFREDEWITAVERKYDETNYKVSQTLENCDIVWDNNQNNYWIKLTQDTKNIKKYGRLLGNIHYKEDSWYVTIDPIKFKHKYKVGDVVKEGSLQSTRVRDKFIKIRVKYTGEDLVIITALNTLLTISYS